MFTGGSHFSQLIQPVMHLGHSLDDIRENRENMVVPSQIICGLWQDDLPEIQHQKWEQHGTTW
jgi:hypothetical protein